MNNHDTTSRPRITPIKRAPVSPAVATAQQIQEHLRAGYGITADIRTNRGVALLVLGRVMNVWVMVERIRWDSGMTDTAGTKVCTTVPAEQAAQAASLIAARFHQIRSGD
ncbi:hypothetical protein ACQP1K_00355 [Sphaerimonospora sp. CA-214678]|uniref:hypothetical protein n=1 Tax=Sphaerimonospora sp. CA-214678 TaxID=3240029 RepID=UPI003D9139E9